MSDRAYHTPIGDPCERCLRAADLHRVSHTPVSDPCIICGLRLNLHRRAYHKPIGDPCSTCGLPASRHKAKERDAKEKAREKKRKKEHRKAHGRKRNVVYIGIDGEGKTENGVHKYTLLAASTIDGKRVATVQAASGERLTTEQCLDLVLSLPTHQSKIFAFSFNYDLTKMLMDLPNRSLYELFRPELRAQRIVSFHAKRRHGPIPVLWGKYRLNLQGTKFTVQRGRKRAVIWDLFKFFQGKFVTAIKDWKIGSPELHARIEAMKNKRALFQQETDSAITAYCLEECRCIAELASSLTKAHESVGLKLRSYYGAGSSGAAMLTAMGIKDKLSAVPDEMKMAVASAFSGGRFENSVIGTVPEFLWNKDISSAYVYHLAFLPCLIHGKWTKTDQRKDIENASTALVRYRLGSNPGIEDWGPFPFRTDDGSISYPIESGGGWCWKAEYLMGERLFSHVQFREAWVYRTECDCQPFEAISKYYKLRLKLGKEGPGIVVKLGMNSCYGKLAQSVGNAIFNNWIWAGLITSGCRAQILEIMGLHKERRNLLMIATDGIYTRENIVSPKPIDTDTGFTGKPLGGWETKPCAKGMFVARPGIYFPLSPTDEELADVRGRGVGKAVVLENWNLIVKAWEQGGINGLARVPNVRRFCGAKTSISKSAHGYKRAFGEDDGPSYGQWVEREVFLGFTPMPKRDSLHEDGLTLTLRKFPTTLESMPYDRALKSRDANELAAAAQELLEQPDGDYEDADSQTE